MPELDPKEQRQIERAIEAAPNGHRFVIRDGMTVRKNTEFENLETVPRYCFIYSLGSFITDSKGHFVGRKKDETEHGFDIVHVLDPITLPDEPEPAYTNEPAPLSRIEKALQPETPTPPANGETVGTSGDAQS